MTSNLRETILERLKLIGPPAPDAPSWKSFPQREWEQALNWLDYSGLALQFLSRSKRCGTANVLPETVTEELEKRSATNRLRTAAILREFDALTQAFTHAGVSYAVLKGIALLPDYCADPTLRTQYDHDVLVAPDSLAEAGRLLQAAGYQRKITTGDEHAVAYRPPEPKLRFARTSEGLYSPELGRSIELHLSLWEENEEKIHLNLPEDFLSRAQCREWHGTAFMALSDEDCLLFQILHAFKHILRNWCRLLIFFEIGTFLHGRSGDRDFWARFAERIVQLRWAPEATFVVFTLARELFGAPIPPELQAAINSRRTPALKLWISRYGRRAALSNFHGDKCSLFLHEEFVDSPQEWAAIRRRRLFPIQRPHRPPTVVFQRGFSRAGKFWLESTHALRRVKHHGLAGLAYAVEYPRWLLLRRLQRSASGTT
jgi:hypothetical protein